jgi:hypothetical protein
LTRHLVVDVDVDVVLDFDGDGGVDLGGTGQDIADTSTWTADRCHARRRSRIGYDRGIQRLEGCRDVDEDGVNYCDADVHATVAVKVHVHADVNLDVNAA